MFTVTFEANFKDLKDKFVRADRATYGKAKERISALSKRWIFLARDEAPKKSGYFRQTITADTFEEENAIGFRGYSERPLGKWIIEGTKPHKIEAVRADALKFFWKKVGMFTIVPKGGGDYPNARPGTLIIKKGYVNHPGTKPNLFTERALNRFVPEAKQALNEIARQWTMTFNGEA